MTARQKKTKNALYRECVKILSQWDIDGVVALMARQEGITEEEAAVALGGALAGMGVGLYSWGGGDLEEWIVTARVVASRKG